MTLNCLGRTLATRPATPSRLVCDFVMGAASLGFIISMTLNQHSRNDMK